MGGWGGARAEWGRRSDAARLRVVGAAARTAALGALVNAVLVQIAACAFMTRGGGGCRGGLENVEPNGREIPPRVGSANTENPPEHAVYAVYAA